MKVDFDFEEKQTMIHLETDEEMIDYYDCLTRNKDILDEIENECKKHLSNPSDYLFFLKDFYENERKDNV